MKIPEITPLFPGNPQSATVGGKPAAAGGPALIPLERWAAHRGCRTLPDGTPLHLTPDGVDLYERITGSVGFPETFGEATVLLWVATRTDEQMDELWSPAPATEADPDGDGTGGKVPGLFPLALHRLMRQWRNAVMPAGATMHAHRLALELWRWQNETAVEVDHAALPEETAGAAEKKTAGAGPTGWFPLSSPSPEETAESGTDSDESSTAPSWPSMPHGSTPKAFQLSRPEQG